MTTETVERGEEFKRHKDGRTVRVMAVADGYAMVRIKGCMPFVQSVKGLLMNFSRVPK